MSNLPKSPIFLIETVCVAGSYTMTLRLFAPSAILEGSCLRKPGSEEQLVWPLSMRPKIGLV